MFVANVLGVIEAPKHNYRLEYYNGTEWRVFGRLSEHSHTGAIRAGTRLVEDCITLHPGKARRWISD